MNERQVWLLNELLQSKSFLETPSGRVAILEAEIAEYIEDLAVVVHTAMDIIKPDALFTLIKIGGKVLCISRSTIKEIDVGNILSRFGGGGHPNTASATFPIGIKEVKKNLKESIMKITKHSRLIKHPARVIPLTDTAAEAYHTLSHLSLDYAPVGDEEGNISGVVERAELKKAVRHLLGSHSVKEFISGSVLSIDESKSPGEIAKLMASSGFPFLILTKDNKISAVVDNKEEDDKKFPFIEISKQQIITKLDRSLKSQIHDIIKAARDTAIEMGIAGYLVGGMVRDVLMGL
ncbi:MAG: hypothetical protein IIB38_09650, partial [Candidatus Hydrogenedentes bacterium]|nr:hypothetical protein [Candidatus Hydrogenedentota bacterium]